MLLTDFIKAQSGKVKYFGMCPCIVVYYILDTHILNFALEYLPSLGNILAFSVGAQIESFEQRNRDRKSHETVPLCNASFENL